MNIKILLLALCLSSSFLTSTFAMDANSPQEKTCVGSKRSYEAAFEQPQEKERPTKLSITGSPVWSMVLKADGEDAFGVLAHFPLEGIYNIFSFLNPIKMRLSLINHSFRTLTLGYEKERIGMMGCGEKTLLDYSDSLLSLYYRERTKYFFEKTPTTIPSISWHNTSRVLGCPSTLNHYI